MHSPRSATRSGLRRRLRGDRFDWRAVVSGRAAVQLLAQALATAGVSAAYGRPYPGLPVTEVDDPQVALLLCHAHRAVHGAPAVAHLGGGRLVVASRRPALAPGARRGDRSPPLSLPAPVRVIDEAEELFTLGPAVAEAVEGGGLCLQLDVDPASRLGEGAVAVPANADEYPEPDPSVVADLAAAWPVVVLAGPDVIGRRAVGGLRALAAAGRLGVLNTWGAKGVFHWRSRHHWATVGLQELDFELGGLPGADVVLAVGLDEAEAPERLWSAVSAPRASPPSSSGRWRERWGVPGPFPDHAAAARPVGRRHPGRLGRDGIAADAVTRHRPLRRGVRPRRAGRRRSGDGRVLGGSHVRHHTARHRIRARPTGPWLGRCVRPRRAPAALPGDLGWPSSTDPSTSPPRPCWSKAGDSASRSRSRRGGLTANASARTPISPGCTALAGGRPDVVSLATDDHQLAEMIAVAGPVRAWTERLTGAIARRAASRRPSSARRSRSRRAAQAPEVVTVALVGRLTHVRDGVHVCRLAAECPDRAAFSGSSTGTGRTRSAASRCGA